MYGTYTGNSTEGKIGTYSQKIETGFRVGAVILTAGISTSVSSTTVTNLGLLTGSMASDYFECDDTGFTVKEECYRQGGSYKYLGFNEAGTTYYYLAFHEV